MSDELVGSLTNRWQKALFSVASLGLLSIVGCSEPKPAADATTAIRALKSHQYRQAIAAFTVLLEAYPGSVRWLRLRGFAFDELGEYEAGIADFTDVLKRLPDDVPCLNNRAYAFYKTNRLGDAVADYNRALELDPAFSPARSNRALVLVALAHYSQALGDLNRAIAAGGAGNSSLYNLQGYCLLQLNRPTAAVQAFDKAIALDAAYMDALRNREAAYRLLARSGKGTL